jgi:glycine cleavage system H protein
MSRFFTKDHEWIEVEGASGTVGITDYAQHQLGDVVYVELPAIGKDVAQHREAAVVESVKAASDVFSPVDGKVTAVNDDLSGEPAHINSDPEGTAWIFRVALSKPDQLSTLMDEAAYKDYCAGLG